MNFKDKSAIITGGIRGIGKEIAFKLAQNGANIAIIDVYSPHDAEKIISEIKSNESKIIYLQSDVTDNKLAKSAVYNVHEIFGRIDILVNNAGINQDSVIWKMTEEQWDSVINTNLKGFFNYIQSVSPFLRNQKSGKIVNISSINGLRGKFGQSNYSASKAGIIGLTKSVARELGSYGINVNAIAPGFIETDMTGKLTEEFKQNALKEIILGRFGLPEDIANTVLFLCSDMARHITGEVIKVDGGQYI